MSWWVSPKRTRSYPYARVYDSLSFPGRKVTVIPIIKDEGKEGDRVYLIEGKHSRRLLIPSLVDIKDGLIKMILFTNLREVKVGDKEYNSVAVLKLTSDVELTKKKLRATQIETLKLLRKEAEINNFTVILNETNLQDIEL